MYKMCGLSTTSSATLKLDQRWRLLLPEHAQIVPDGPSEMLVHHGERNRLVVVGVVGRCTAAVSGQQQLAGRQHQAAVQMLDDDAARITVEMMPGRGCRWGRPCDCHGFANTIGESWPPANTEKRTANTNGGAKTTGNGVLVTVGVVCVRGTNKFVA